MNRPSFFGLTVWLGCVLAILKPVAAQPMPAPALQCL